MTGLIAMAALLVAIVAVSAITLIVQHRRAFERVTSALVAHKPEVPAAPDLHLVGRRTQVPSYIPPTDEVVWRHRMRTLQIGHTVLHPRARPEFELSL